MKRTLLITMIFVGAAALYSCDPKPKGEQPASEEQAPASDDAQAEEVAYACPMHPDITGKKGDTCSKCGMSLEEVKKDGDDHSHDHQE